MKAVVIGPPMPVREGLAITPTRKGMGLPGLGPLEWYALRLLNRARARRLGPGSALEWRDELAAVARTHSRWQLMTGRVGHRDESGGGPAERLARAGIAFGVVGENVAFIGPMPHPGRKWLEEMYEGLMDSPGHRRNILARAFQHAGIGLAWTVNGMVMTQVFQRDRQTLIGEGFEAAIARIRNRVRYLVS